MKIVVALSKPIKLLRKYTKCLAPPSSPAASRDTKHAKVKKNAVAVTQTETTRCGICIERIKVDKTFSIPICGHRYCLSCMSKHVKYMLHNARIPRCPHDECGNQLTPESCKKLVSSAVLEVMRQRLIEASIPASQRVYCPNPKCSALFSKTHLITNCKGDDAKKYSCPKCLHFLCIDCKLPWHRGLECHEYRRQNPEYGMIKSLASQNSWRHCPDCNHMVSLDSGCYHIYCRCGHQFCYKCGAAWKDRMATCECPVWDERNS